MLEIGKRDEMRMRLIYYKTSLNNVRRGGIHDVNESIQVLTRVMKSICDELDIIIESLGGVSEECQAEEQTPPTSEKERSSKSSSKR
jgi:hypothetical protein